MHFSSILFIRPSSFCPFPLLSSSIPFTLFVQHRWCSLLFIANAKRAGCPGGSADDRWPASCKTLKDLKEEKGFYRKLLTATTTDRRLKTVVALRGTICKVNIISLARQLGQRSEEVANLVQLELESGPLNLLQYTLRVNRHCTFNTGFSSWVAKHFIWHSKE